MEKSRQKLSRDDQMAHLAILAKDAVYQGIQAREGATGTLTVTMEINLSQGGIGRAFLREDFRKEVSRK